MKIDNASISIVMHGGVFESNIADILNALMNYRTAFKEAEIIFSISSSDFVDFESSSTSQVTSYKKSMSNACRTINEYADKIAYGYKAQPLPPVFRDAPKCHANHMIESAKCGLNLATREYVLRTRNDLQFKDRSVVDEYIKLRDKYYSTGKYTIFSSPVMISSLYTLNPFAGGRLPFHYSDWFNFGKLSDIKPIWDAPLVTLDFMTYYNSHPYMAGSKEKERNFFSRTAIEQYVYFTFFSSRIPNLKLDYHNDDKSISESIQILLDNFIIADIYGLNTYYPKYYHGFNSYADNNTRIMQRAWEHLSSHRKINPADFLSVDREDIRDYKPTTFPLRVPSDQLHSKTGFHFGKSILIPYDAPPGVACFGPYITLKRGHYTATARLSSLYPEESECKINIFATGEEGQKILSSREYAYSKKQDYQYDFIYLSLDFINDFEDLRKFEIVIESSGRVDMAIDYIEIDRRK